MSVTVSEIITLLNTHINDEGTERVSAAERLEFVSEAVTWLQEELGNDHMVRTYDFPFIDGIYVYRITSGVASLLESSSIRRALGEHSYPFAHKDAEDVAIAIGRGDTEEQWAIDYKNNQWYLLLNYQSKYTPKQLASFESLNGDGGTWAADTTNSDATNVTIDSNTFTEGSASLNFDIDVSQSGNNKATISSTITSVDASEDENISYITFDIEIPDVTYISSITLRWGTDSSNYWSYSATSQHGGAALVSGVNTIAIPWASASVTATPDASDIAYVQFDVNYSASQLDDTDFRIDNLRIVKPETLTFHYTSSYIGTDTTGATQKSTFTATTDIPYFSGVYDKYKYAVAHKAASIVYGGKLRNTEQATSHLKEAQSAVSKQKKTFGSPVSKKVRTFKPVGVNFRRRRW